MAKDAIKMSGKITKMHTSRDYDVLLENGLTIKASISGKMSLHNIKMIPGDLMLNLVHMIWAEVELF
ncbi:translation initiation factor IF-1 [Metamycoplasma hominis]|uniref:translation initiation factor IF-1 n=1 Tax=Metamycoplasma hominis TaxID=2098 RepID=UPI003A5C7D6D